MDVTPARAGRFDDNSALERRFEALIFDWDGTAVPDRDSDAREVRSLIEALCAHGMHIAVVAGTHVDNVDAQLGARPTGPGRLLFAVNHGSEVFAVDGQGPQLVHRREATNAEDVALDRAAALTIEQLAARGLTAEVVSKRLNRRKIDLIPLAEWADPPRTQIDQLLAAVEARVGAANLAGLPEVVELAQRAAHAAGLGDPRVTSDVKHIEIGLTDKSDAARHMYAELWRNGIGPSLVLIAGDELGPLRGLAGQRLAAARARTRGRRDRLGWCRTERRSAACPQSRRRARAVSGAARRPVAPARAARRTRARRDARLEPVVSWYHA